MKIEFDKEIEILKEPQAEVKMWLKKLKTQIENFRESLIGRMRQKKKKCGR